MTERIKSHGVKLRRDRKVADPVFVKLMLDLQLARNGQGKPKAKRFERIVWDALLEYLTTLESSVY
jgi:hypothetical protein